MEILERISHQEREFISFLVNFIKLRDKLERNYDKENWSVELHNGRP